MTKSGPGAVFTREFRYKGEVSKISIGPPKTNHKSGECSCPYSIVVPAKTINREAVGIDPFQALILALIQLGSLLYSRKVIDLTEVVWLDPNSPGYLGVPVLEVDREAIPGGPRMSITL